MVSLFTKVPIDRAIDVARDRLINDSSLKDRNMLSPAEVLKLLQFCLNATYLTYLNEYYQQTFGTAMGSPVSVIVANLVMEDVENRALSTCHSPPLFWKRYVDDICTAMEEYSIEEFQDHLNSIEPSIKFTSESESDGKLAFLDTEITHHEDGSMTTTVYRKKIHTDKYLSFDSHHPMARKNAVARTLFKRAEVICSSLPERIAEELHITETLKENGYPSSVIANNSRTYPKLPRPSQEEDKKTATICRTCL